MSDNGSAFFHANKKNRNAAFSFPNEGGLAAEAGGDQSSRLHPTPTVLPAKERNPGPPAFTPAGTFGDESGVTYQGTPFGSDKNTKSHIQTADIGQARRVLPGEQDDPRLC